MSEEREYSEARQRQIKRHRMEERRRRRRKKRIIRDTVLAAMLAVFILIVYGIGKLASFLIGNISSDSTSDKKPAQVKEEATEAVVDTSLLTPEYLDCYNQIADMSKDYPEVKTLYEGFSEYPVDLLELVIRNPETVEFVKEYPLKHNIKVIVDVSGDYEPGKIPLFIQWDERWGYGSYGDNLMAINGCGPTCVSMVAVGLTGNTNYNPRHVADLSESNGYYSDTGTSWSLMTEGAAEFGITGYTINITSDSIINELNQGHPIIASMQPGDFTTTGHFIVLTGIDEDGKIIINDPNSKIRSEKRWETEVIISQSKSMWAYTV